MGGWGYVLSALVVAAVIIVVPWWTLRWDRRLELERIEQEVRQGEAKWERIEQEVRQGEAKWDRLHKALTASTWDLNPGTDISCVVTVPPVPKWRYVGAVDTDDQGRCYLWRSDDPQLCEPDSYHSIPIYKFWSRR